MKKKEEIMMFVESLLEEEDEIIKKVYVGMMEDNTVTPADPLFQHLLFNAICIHSLRKNVSELEIASKDILKHGEESVLRIEALGSRAIAELRQLKDQTRNVFDTITNDHPIA